MPRSAEVYGKPFQVGVQLQAQDIRCPYMESECDGGGNRHQTSINPARYEAVTRLLPVQNLVSSAICSIQTQESEPWIVCPRRLLYLHTDPVNEYQSDLFAYLVDLFGFNHTDIAVWSEVSWKKKGTDIETDFDYRFDYIIAPVTYVPVESAAAASGCDVKKLGSLRGLVVEQQTGNVLFPTSGVGVLEVMTSSTSSSNKKLGNTISEAFVNSVLGNDHQAPGINKRQVWARMVSQLIAKSEMGLAWGGKTVWVLQKNLVDYIARATGLPLNDFRAEQLSEVNIVSASVAFGKDGAAGSLRDLSLFSGAIGERKGGGFIDIVRAPSIPSRAELNYALLDQARKPLILGKKQSRPHEV